MQAPPRVPRMGGEVVTVQDLIEFHQRMVGLSEAYLELYGDKGDKGAAKVYRERLEWNRAAIKLLMQLSIDGRQAG